MLRYVTSQQGCQWINQIPHLGHLSVRSRAQGLKRLKEGGHEQILDQGSDWHQIFCLDLQHTEADEREPLGMVSGLSHGRAPKQRRLAGSRKGVP